jgi:hypothetical protein
MFYLTQSLAAWDSTDFSRTFRQEVEALDSALLPLQQGLARSSHVSEEPFRLMIIESGDDASSISIKAGIFYSGIIAGCSCADDPTPIESQPEYCEVVFVIDKQSGETQASLSSD